LAAKTYLAFAKAMTGLANPNASAVLNFSQGSQSLALDNPTPNLYI